MARHSGRRRKPVERKKFKGLFIFDADDTLWSTQPLYSRAKRRLGHLARCLKADDQKVLRRLEEYDLRNARLLGLSQSRFPLSMRQALEASIGEKDARAEWASLAEEFGKQVFSARATVFAHAATSLKALSRLGYACALLTTGDKELQLRRLRQSGLERWFAYVSVVPKKTPGSYTAVSRKLKIPPRTVWAVGNSYTNDLEPARMSRFRTVLIRRQSWEYEPNAPGDPDYNFNNLRNFVAWLRRAKL